MARHLGEASTADRKARLLELTNMTSTDCVG